MRSRHLGRGRERPGATLFSFPPHSGLRTMDWGWGCVADQPKAWNWHQGIGGAGRWQESLSDESEGPEHLSSVSPGRCLEGF